MKTPNVISKFLGLGSLLALAIMVALPSANAGPGVAYWQRTARNKTNQPVAQATAPTPSDKVCTTARTEDVTELRSTWPNGKGPVRRVKVGSREVCDSCATTTVMRRSRLPNGKAPLRPVKIVTTHVCDASCIKA